MTLCFAALNDAAAEEYLCEGWEYDGSRLEDDIAKMRRSDLREKMTQCYVLDCSETVELLRYPKVYAEVNAGGSITIVSNVGGEEARDHFVSDELIEGFLAFCSCCEDDG